MRISDWSSDVCSSDLSRGRRGDEIETELALQALLHDLQMQEPEEAAAEAEAEGGAGFRLVEKGGVVQRQLGQRIAQFIIVGGVDRKQDSEQIGRAMCRERGCQCV